MPGVNYRMSFKWDLFCTVCDKNFTAAPIDIFRGCVSCACGKRYYSNPKRKKDKLLEVLDGREISFDDSLPILGCYQKVEFTCRICNLIWMSQWTTMTVRLGGCPRCVGRYEHSEQDYIDKINSAGSGSYTYLSKDFDHKISSASSVNVLCLSCNNPWKKCVADAVAGNYGCPQCASYGFNPSIPATLYILSVKKDGKLLSYKFGISATPKQRVRGLKSKNCLEITPLAFFKFELGSDAYKMEQILMKRFNRYLTKDQMLDGYTETFRPEDLSSVLEVLHKNLMSGDLNGH